MSSPKNPFDKEIYGPTYRPEGSGQHGTAQEGDDIPEKGPGASRVTLGDYLSNLTKTSPHANHYAVEAGSKPAASHRDVSGTPKIFAAFKDGGAETGSGAESTFLDEVLAAGEGIDGAVKADDFVLTGRSTYKNPKVNAGILSMEDAGSGPAYEKGVGATRGTGHTLFSGIQKVVGDVKWYPGKGYTPDQVGKHDIQKRVSTILQNNRFHPTKSSPYILDGEFTSGPQGSLGSVQRTLGQYDPASVALDARKLMDIGRKIMVAGTGHQASEVEDLAALIPNLNQLGIPFMNVPTSTLDASAVLKEIGGGAQAEQGERSQMLNPGGTGVEGVSVAEQVSHTGRGALSTPGDSYGHLNSYYEPFTGAFPFGMAMVALGGLLSLLVQAAVIVGIITLLTLIPSADPLGRNPENPLTLPKGRRQQLRSYAALVGPVMEWLGVPELESNKSLFDCVFRGIGTFYNVPNLTGLPSFGELADMLSACVEQGGFLAVIIRQGTRDLEQVVNAAVPMGRGSLTAIVGGVIAIIKNLGDSNAVKFLMICVRLGDLMTVGDTYQFAPYRMNPDLLPPSGTTRLAKSRTSKDDPTMIWSHSSLPSAFLLPKSFAVASATYGLGKGLGFSAVQHPRMAERFASSENLNETTGRISADYVKEIENKLETEYVPFYFQDLRTNEIVSFHAFLGGIKDDYSPNYNSMGGYGRMDKVQIYESTERSISFSFHVIATSPGDFDAMWYSINKLVSMVYPQWSGGTVMKSSDDIKFVMPFSQIPAASPMVRLRIGDLIKSNYSRFNLARIFGLGHGDVPDGSFHIAGNDLNAAFDNFDPNDPSFVTYFTDHGVPPTDPSDTTNGFLDGEIVDVQVGIYQIVDPDDGKPSKMMIGKTTKAEIVGKEWPGFMFIPFMTEPLAHPPPYKVKFTLDADKEAAGDIGEKEFYVSHRSVNMSIEQIIIDLPDMQPELPDKITENDVSKWFLPENNAIVRSFEATAGRGLAGFITSLSFNHDDATWETRKLGSRAPMWMTVDVGFQPIHDLPPGLDAEGFNRAPLYNVGAIMNGLSGPDMHDSNILDGDDEMVAGWTAERSNLIKVEPKDSDTNSSD